MDTDEPHPLKYSVKQLPSGERTISFDISGYPVANREKLMDYLKSEPVAYWITPEGLLELLRPFHPYEIQELVKLFSSILNQ